MPGIFRGTEPEAGFGKRLDDNLALVRALGELRSVGYPVLLGASHKTFLGQLVDRPVEQRGAATLATTAAAFARGAELIRVHEAAPSRDLLRVLQAIADE